jgi:hypothetical protein
MTRPGVFQCFQRATYPRPLATAGILVIVLLGTSYRVINSDHVTYETHRSRKGTGVTGKYLAAVGATFPTAENTFFQASRL